MSHHKHSKSKEFNNNHKDIQRRSNVFKELVFSHLDHAIKNASYKCRESKPGWEELSVVFFSLYCLVIHFPILLIWYTIPNPSILFCIDISLSTDCHMPVISLPFSFWFSVFKHSFFPWPLYLHVHRSFCLLPPIIHPKKTHFTWVGLCTTTVLGTHVFFLSETPSRPSLLISWSLYLLPS